MKPDWAAIRSEFPALAHWTYLNTATFGQLPRRAVEAVNRHWRQRDEFACADFLDWYADMDRIRGTVARLIHAAPGDIAFISNASAALSTVIAGIGLREGDCIVTLGDEFPNYLYLANVREVPWERFYESIDSHTRLVAVSEVNYATGFRAPIGEISKFLRGRGIPFFVDGSQSVGALQFDVEATPVDVLAVHGYKWLASPSSAGFLYVAPDFRKQLPPNVIGWRSHKTWRDVDHLHHGVPEFTDSAEKYEGGGVPFPLIYAMEASINLMHEIGPALLEQRVLELADLTRVRLRKLGAVVEDTGSQVVAAKFPGVDPTPLALELKARRVIVAARHGYLRVSPHFYNNEEDIEALERGLYSTLTKNNPRAGAVGPAGIAQPG